MHLKPKDRGEYWWNVAGFGFFSFCATLPLTAVGPGISVVVWLVLWIGYAVMMRG